MDNGRQMKRVEKRVSLDAGKWLSLRPHLIPCLLATAMLVGAFGRWPYGYYRLLRWVTFSVSLFVAYRAYVSKIDWLVWLFLSVAVLFNPLFPIHLKRDTWQIIDGIAAIAFLAAGLSIVPKTSQEKAPENEY